MNTRDCGVKFIRAALAIALVVAAVMPLSAQQGDLPQQNSASPNSFATPSPTVSPAPARDREQKKHQRKHRGKRRQVRSRDQNRATTRQGGHARDRQQHAAGTQQPRQPETDLTPGATGAEGKTAPENVAPQPDTVPQPTPR